MSGAPLNTSAVWSSAFSVRAASPPARLSAGTGSITRRHRLHRAWQPLGEPLRRELQCPAPRRALQPRDLHLGLRGQGPLLRLVRRLQQLPAAQLHRLLGTSSIRSHAARPAAPGPAGAMITAKTGLAGDASENRAAQMPQYGRKHVAVTPSTPVADASDTYNRPGRLVPPTRSGTVATDICITEPSQKVDPFSGSGQGGLLGLRTRLT
jgi:hypothetical protein